MRSRAWWALDAGAALIGIAAINPACADVRSIHLEECLASCVLPAADAAAAADVDEADRDIALSVFGRARAQRANDVHPSLIFDPKALPPLLVSGLASPIAAVAAQTPDSPGVSPYAFLADVIDIPHSADSRTVPFVLVTPSLASRLGDFLWASNDFFGPPSRDIAYRRSVPLSNDAGQVTARPTMQTTATPTPSPSPPSEPPSADAAEPFGQIWGETGQATGFSSDGAELSQ